MNIQAHPEALLTPVQLDELRSSLNNERQELAGSIAALNALIEANRDREIRPSGNTASVFILSVIRLANKKFATVPQEIRGRAYTIAEHHKTMIIEIDAALGRIDEREYQRSTYSRELVTFA